MRTQLFKILLNTIPVVLMILLIPLIKNDFLLTGVYIVIIGLSLLIKYEPKDLLFLTIGFIAMLISEYFFIRTGVETFNRDSFFGIMPLWLLFLWAYAFVVIKRAINIINLK